MFGTLRRAAGPLLAASFLVTGCRAPPAQDSETPPPRFGDPIAWTDTTCRASQNNSANDIDRIFVVTHDPRSSASGFDDVGTVIFYFKQNAGSILIARGAAASDILDMEDNRSFFRKHSSDEAKVFVQALIRWRGPAALACGVS